MQSVALHLFTVREAAARDFPNVLRRVAEIGYKGVSFSGLHGWKPVDLSAVVNDLGLEVCASHHPFPTAENVRRIADTELTLGNTRVVSGFGPEDVETPDSCRKAAEQLNQAADLLKPYGLSFGIHNHWWEFHKVDGGYAYDVLMQEAPGVFGELDVYWAAYGKADPAEVVARYRSRLPVLHIKDGTLEENAPHTAVGSGVLDMPAIVRAADPNVLQWLAVEIDSCAGDMFEAVEQSYDYLTSTGLAAGNR